MVPKFALLSSLLLASVALASPTSRLADRLARRRENRQSQPLNRVNSPSGGDSNVEYSSNWAGGVLNEAAVRGVSLTYDNSQSHPLQQGTFASVCGTFTVPTPSGSDGSAASAWVGIDGDTCQNAILQTGVDFTVSGGGASYDGKCLGPVVLNCFSPFG